MDVQPSTYNSNDGMKKTVALLLLFLSIGSLKAQDTLYVLFLGNSYTYFNNLPQLVSDLSSSAGKTIFYDSNAIGGYTLSNHLADATSLAKIRQGTWDYVVIQEQSQIPTIDYYRYNNMYVAAQGLADSIHAYNPCTKLMTFMTWGRRFGGQQCDQSMTYCSPVFADFNHMQDSLTSAYEEVSDIIEAQCAPAGVAWQNILNDTSIILHNADNSHPALEGSYVAACVFFDALWKLHSSGSGFTGGLPASAAAYFQAMADSTYFNSISDWNRTIFSPTAGFTFSQQGNDIFFTNTSTGPASTSYLWDFGDGSTSIQPSPAHSYLSPGVYTITLTAASCTASDTLQLTIPVGTTGIAETTSQGYSVFPNPFNERLTLSFDQPVSTAEIEIYDVLGRSVLTATMSSIVSYIIDTSSLQSGAYWLINKSNPVGGCKILYK